MQKALEDGSVELSGPEQTQLDSEDNPGKPFLKSLHFQFQDGMLMPSGSNDSELNGAYRAIFALWLTDDDLDEKEKSKWCVLI